MTILTVDDSTTIRRIIKKCLSDLKLNVLEAADGITALRILEESATGQISLVILDWNLPGRSGIDVLRAMKANPKLRNIVVMMLTSEADQSCVVNALRLGAQNYLTKPFDSKMLSLKVQESLELATKARVHSTLVGDS
jgi:two-component system chemotaxis response regulator CheY